MKWIAILTVLMPVYIYAAGNHDATSSQTQAQAQPPEPTPPTMTPPESHDTTLLGTKKQNKEAKQKANKEMKKKAKETKEPISMPDEPYGK